MTTVLITVGALTGALFIGYRAAEAALAKAGDAMKAMEEMTGR